MLRNPSALRSSVVVGDAHQGLPGIVSTGIMDALMICHRSWQAGIALMDARCSHGHRWCCETVQHAPVFAWLPRDGRSGSGPRKWT